MARRRENGGQAHIDAAVLKILERARRALRRIFVKTEAEVRARGVRDAFDEASRRPITRLKLEGCTYVVTRLAAARGEKLSRRQREVASLFLEGLPMKLIAKKLGISPRTVETHLSRLCHKYHVDSRIALAQKITLLS